MTRLHGIFLIECLPSRLVQCAWALFGLEWYPFYTTWCAEFRLAIADECNDLVGHVAVRELALEPGTAASRSCCNVSKTNSNLSVGSCSAPK